MYKEAPLHIWIGVNQPGRGADEGAIVIQMPAELKQLAEPIRAVIAATELALGRTKGPSAVDYGAIERQVEELAREVERATHEAVLASLDIDAQMIEVGGKLFRRAHRALGHYHTMAGTVSIERATYREVGIRNAPTVDAISLRTGAINGWLPKTAQAMAHSVQLEPSREAAKSAGELGRLPYASATFDRVAHQVGEHWLAEQADIEIKLAYEEKIPEAAHSISAALDRVSIPMEEARPRPRGRPRKDAPAKPVTRQHRMAYVGTVTLHDEDGASLRTIRFGCMPKSDATVLCEAMANQAYAWIERHPGLSLSLLADGAPEMWNLLEAAFPESMFPDQSRRVDYWHLIEKLAPAANLMFGSDATEDELARWKRGLLWRSRAAHEILAELRKSGLESKYVGDGKPVHDAITYLENHSERMDYASARRKKLPIGSGNVEATCKTLVAVRMKRSGARWKERSGEHVLALRALAMSDRWQSGMAALHESRRTSVKRVA